MVRELFRAVVTGIVAALVAWLLFSYLDDRRVDEPPAPVSPAPSGVFILPSD